MIQTEEKKPVVSQSRVRVRYAETDQMGVVYHANYLVWFEIGRVDFIRTLGLDYRTMEREDGVGIAVVDVSVRYKSPARYDEELVIETRLLAARGPVIKFAYRIVRSDDAVLLCEGETVHVVVDRQMKKAPLPEKYAKRFTEVLIR
ncbi:MAG: thioesterase family protein [Edaphobacter sp.]|uniref:acyl-CoA thioesterase n=1 Tax=Edaphobacter sp. TaxID=1934404 RepID=UPI002383DE24|nr:thioesterase family protein [Edaphobacter sp.]MDE1176229.1 thioesterase family protein [Edaphobacter sp.]